LQSRSRRDIKTVETSHLNPTDAVRPRVPPEMAIRNTRRTKTSNRCPYDSRCACELVADKTGHFNAAVSILRATK
jgi:hypothetical protein